MDCRLHHLPELAHTHVHRVGDAIQPSHPLSPPSPPALLLSQHQGLCQRVGSSHQVTKLVSYITKCCDGGRTRSVYTYITLDTYHTHRHTSHTHTHTHITHRIHAHTRRHWRGPWPSLGRSRPAPAGGSLISTAPWMGVSTHQGKGFGTQDGESQEEGQVDESMAPEDEVGTCRK